MDGGESIRIDRMYTLAEVDEAERRIREAVPDALISRGDFDWSLAVCRSDKRCAYIVFQHFDDGREIRADIDAVIAELKKPCATH